MRFPPFCVYSLANYCNMRFHSSSRHRSSAFLAKQLSFDGCHRWLLHMDREVSIFSVIAGWGLSALVCVALLADAGINLFAPQLLATDMAASGFPPELATTLGLIILVCVVLYAIPATAVLGAVMITGFLGGAISIHFRLGEIFSPPQLICLMLGVLAWGGLYLRDARIRNIMPIRL